MKKLITVLVLAGTLSVPSVVFAEANWYGSLRGGLTTGGGNDAKFSDYGSRWGIRGSNEVSEGLSANYRFEHKISTSNASMPGGRLAYVGLTGGFGTISLGQIWSASYNAIGGLSDPAWVNSNTLTSYRYGDALSYSVSTGSVSLQIDAIMSGDLETDSDLDHFEFGLTFNASDNFSVAFAHQNLNAFDADANHLAVQMSLGSLSAYVTYMEAEAEISGLDFEGEGTRFGISGPIGENDLSFYMMARNLESEGVEDITPWLVGITKGLGSGASAFAEYFNADDDESGTLHLGLVVNF